MLQTPEPTCEKNLSAKKEEERNYIEPYSGSRWAQKGTSSAYLDLCGFMYVKGYSVKILLPP